MRASQPKSFGKHRNSGAVLAISMIMVLLMTTIGLAGMRSARLETIMAQNLQQKKTSFNNAESVASVGEATWDSMMVSCLNSIKDCPDATLASLAPAMLTSIHSLDWDASSGVQVVDGYGKYYVEYLGQRTIPGELQKRIHIYRITSYAEDETGTAQTMVQTIYRRCLKLDGVPCPD